jgi:enoyl-CoA hydratase/carnithine racemase
MARLTLLHEDEIDTLLFESPILTRSLLGELVAALAELGAKPRPRPLVLASAHPTIFLAGAHLGEIAELDAKTCLPYAALGRRAGRSLGTHPAPVVAAVDGSCSGGGFDLVLACDAIIASPRATFRHPGVQRGLVTGWGGTGEIARASSGAAFRRVLIEASTLDATTLAQLGVIRRVHRDPDREARRTAREIAALDPSRLAAWRHLRGSDFVDRFRAFMIEKS